MTTIEEQLKKDGYLVYKIKGVSMMPMLVQNKDVITLRAKKENERFQENDVVLYKRLRGKVLTLHRIIEVRDHDYVILGDNCIQKEYGIKDEDILGLLTEFTHNDKHYKVDDADYLNYVSKLRKNENKRIFKRKLMNKMKNSIKKVIHSNG